MEEEKDPGNDTPIEKGAKAMSSYAKYTGMAFQMVAIIGACAYIGYKIDEHFQHHPQWVTAILGVLGVCLSIYQIIRQLKP